LHNKREEEINFFIYAIIDNKSQEDKIIKSQFTSQNMTFILTYSQ